MIRAYFSPGGTSLAKVPNLRKAGSPKLKCTLIIINLWRDTQNDKVA